MRSGNYAVVAANHTLILNWNDQTVPLLRQIAINRKERADGTYDGCAPASRLVISVISVPSHPAAHSASVVSTVHPWADARTSFCLT